jgi:hypothetical protein
MGGSKFNAVNNRGKNFAVAQVGKRMEQVDARIARPCLARPGRFHTSLVSSTSALFIEALSGGTMFSRHPCRELSELFR